jgi:hypothetical protein
VLNLDPLKPSGEAECSNGLIQNDLSFRLGKRYTRIYRATSIITEFIIIIYSYCIELKAMAMDLLSKGV